MSQQQVVIVRTGIANLASVQAGFRRLGAETVVTEDADLVRSADYVMLPGVGAFGAAVREMDKLGLSDAMRDRFAANKKTIAICVGLQVLCKESEESPGAVGLGLIETKVRRFPNTVRVPQLGWNEVTADPAMNHVKDGFAYFANSYHAEEAPGDWKAAYSDHGRRFVAAMEHGNWLVLQFHPELSGPYGESILKSWLSGGTN